MKILIVAFASILMLYCIVRFLWACYQVLREEAAEHAFVTRWRKP